MSATIIAIANEKGGVGKTTTAINLGAELAAQGFGKVLLCDFDPQASLTKFFKLPKSDNQAGDDAENAEWATIYDVVGDSQKGTRQIQDVIVSVLDSLDVAPTDDLLSQSRIGLASRPRREYILKRALADVSDHYDYIILDLAPAFDLLVLNGLLAADWVIVPVLLDAMSIQGVGAFVQRLRDIKEDYDYTPRLLGVLATQVYKQTTHARQILEALQVNAGLRLFSATIPRGIAFAEAVLNGVPIRMYDSRHPGTESYAALAQEVAHRVSKTSES